MAAEPETRSILETLDAKKQLTDIVTADLELFYSRPITAAENEKKNGEYVLYGNLTEAIELDPILLRRIKKTEKPKPVTPPQVAADRPSYPQTFQTTNLEQYRPR